MVDSFFDLRSDKDRAAAVEVIDPEGRRALSLNEAATAPVIQLTEAGFYELRLANGRHEVVGVNADRRESDLDVIPEDVMALWRGKGGQAAQPASPAASRGRAETPYSLWWYFMLRSY